MSPRTSGEPGASDHGSGLEHATTAEFRRMNMVGIELDCISFDDMYVLADQWLADRNSRSHFMAAVNVNCCVSALFDRELGSMYNSADIVGVDSMPFLWWARSFKNRDADRFYSPDLLLELARTSEQTGYRIFLYGGAEGAPDKMEQYLAERFDHVNIVGKYSPPFRELTPEEDRAICDMINDARPDFLFVGLGSPKQDRWIHDHLYDIRGTIMVSAGATFDFFSGSIRQAPRWVQRSGFEWAYRLAQDWRRLWKRYTVYNVVFVGAFILQRIRIKRFPAERTTLPPEPRTDRGGPSPQPAP